MLSREATHVQERSSSIFLSAGMAIHLSSARAYGEFSMISCAIPATGHSRRDAIPVSPDLFKDTWTATSTPAGVYSHRFPLALILANKDRSL